MFNTAVRPTESAIQTGPGAQLGTIPTEPLSSRIVAPAQRSAVDRCVGPAVVILALGVTVVWSSFLAVCAFQLLRWSVS
jgi:hypothetical protein